MDRRVVVFGIDGGTFDVVDPLVAEGEMPRLAAMLRDGVRGTLASTVPALTAPAWTSLLTGKRPENHGILAFFLHEHGTYKRRLASWRHARGPFLWDLLAGAGKTCGMVNIPVTWPPPEVRGFHVSGMMTPSGARHAHPPDLEDELAAEFGYEVDHATDGIGPGMDRGRFAEDVFRVTEKQIRASLHLFERRPTDLFMLVLMGVDRLSHALFHAFDAAHPAGSPEAVLRHGGLLREYHRLLDRAMGDFQDRMGPEDVLLVVSDHGSAPTYGRWKINRWLESRGWLAAGAKGSLAEWTRTALQGLRALDVLDLRHRLPPGLQEKLPTAVRRHDATCQIDWSRTRAYCPEPACRGVYLNVVGRDPMGVVRSGEEYHGLRTAIREAMLEVVVPGTEIRVFPAVRFREEVYRGRFADRAPDLVFDLADNYNVIARLDEGPFLDVERGVTGDHTPRGMFVAWGSGIRRGESIAGARIWDVTPTVLDLLGIPIPGDFDGRGLPIGQAQAVGAS